jgi:Spy/CpxP family protein refolding chaperone
MKTHFIGIILFGFTMVATATQAQSTDNPPQNSTGQQQDGKVHHPGKQGNAANFHRSHFMMRMDLNLTDAQKQQAKALNEDYRNKVRVLEKDDNITLKDYRSQKAKLEQERKAKFQDLLTAEQKDKIAQAKKERNERMQMMAQKRLDRMKTVLSLTDDQVAKLQEQIKSSMDQMQAIRENSSLSSDEKREQMMDLRKRSHESLHSILTADQLKKMEEIRNKRINDWKNTKTDKPS